MKTTLLAFCRIGKYYAYGIVVQLLFLNLAFAAPFNGSSLSGIKESVKLTERIYPLENPVVDVEVTGTVVDNTGQPMPGVTVSVRETTIGTATDIDGNYALSVPEGSTLVFSFIGFETKEVLVDNQSEINITLIEDMASLDEVVVVGYGTMQKRHLTGSVGSIQMDETLQSRPVVDFGQAMYGKVAGVQVLNPSGRPGESSRIQVRGVNSLSAGSEPLIVVDGVALPDFDLNSINSADIQSIEILKDASSAAIYGSRGANGVILVTTKSGKPGVPTLTVNYAYSSQRVMNKVDVMNGPEYAQAAIDAAQNGWIDSGGDPNAPNTIEARGQYKYTWPEALERPETLWDTDFQDLIYRVAPMHQADVSFSGGNENTRYYFSTGIVNQEGIVLKSDYQKYSMNMKASTTVNDWLTVGGMFNMVYENEQVPHGNTSQAAVQYPSIYPVYGNGGYLGGPNSVDGFENHYGILIRAYNAHPLHWNSDNDLRHRNNTAGNVYAEIGILPGLKYRSSFNAFYRRSDRKLYVPGNTGLATTRPARAVSSMGRTLNYAVENLLIYEKSWNGHQINAVGGYESNHREVYNLEGERREYDNDLIPYLGAGNLIFDADDGASEYALVSVLGRVNYNFRDRYMASATFRRDGSSRFGPTKKWGNFPSVSAGWRMSEEGFLQAMEVVSNLNIRTSYGFTGNDNFGNYRWISSMSQGRVPFGNNLTTIYYPSSVENPDLAWERTQQLNIGLDLGLFNNRFSLEADFYRSESDGLLLNVPVPSTSGFTSVFRNIGALETKGIELNVISHNLTGDLNWNSQLTFARNQSTITRLGPDNAPMILRRANMNIINEVGQAPFSFYAYQYDGVYMNQTEIDSDPVEYPFPVYPGHGRYKDVNGDGVISPADRTIIGNAQPDFTWALTNNFRFKNFDFSFMFHGSVGGDFYFADNRRSLFYHEGRNYLKELNNRWRSEEEPGDGHYYKLSVDIDGLEKEASSYWITDGTYSRLKDVTLGYTLPEQLTQRLNIGSARVYFNGVNLFTIQSTSAIDPENSSGSITDPATIGVQHSPYPTAKVYSLGLNAKF
jgi:TonB-linked SusC/RagA family outer membrane protein